MRNSSSLLFSTLITRIFGVKRSKDDAGSRNWWVVSFVSVVTSQWHCQQKLVGCVIHVSCDLSVALPVETGGLCHPCQLWPPQWHCQQKLVGCVIHVSCDLSVTLPAETGGLCHPCQLWPLSDTASRNWWVVSSMSVVTSQWHCQQKLVGCVIHVSCDLSVTLPAETVIHVSCDLSVTLPAETGGLCYPCQVWLLSDTASRNWWVVLSMSGVTSQWHCQQKLVGCGIHVRCDLSVKHASGTNESVIHVRCDLSSVTLDTATDELCQFWPLRFLLLLCTNIPSECAANIDVVWQMLFWIGHKLTLERQVMSVTRWHVTLSCLPAWPDVCSSTASRRSTSSFSHNS